MTKGKVNYPSEKGFKMAIAWFATLAAGAFASLGACGLFASAFFKEAGRRRFVFRVGAFGFTIGGLVLMLGTVAGILGSKELFDGLLLVMFGTGSSVILVKTPRSSKPDEVSH